MSDIYDSLVTIADTATAPFPGRLKSNVERELGLQANSKLTTANTAADEVTSIATHLTTTSGGNYTLTVTIPTLGITYTTANVLYNATASTIEAALDTASPATVSDGDIALAQAGSAGLSDGACTFTCSGDVEAMPVLITIADVDLTGSGAGVGAVTRTTAGQPDRNALQALYDMGIVSGTVPSTGEANSDWVKGTRITGIRPVSDETIFWLANYLKTEEGIVDNRNDVNTLYNLPAALTG